ncbi:MAG: hypothetical protein R6U61_08610 [Thermoplasmata archaeon]
MKDVEEVINGFIEDYDENPQGWSYWIDRSGEFHNIYVLNQGKGYFLKVDSIYTANPMGVGTKVNMEERISDKKMGDFGFRRFTESELENFMYIFKNHEEPEKEAHKMMQKKLKEKPRRLDGMSGGELMMLGPFNRGTPFKNEDESERYSDVDKRLKKELRRRFYREKPMYR